MINKTTEQILKSIITWDTKNKKRLRDLLDEKDKKIKELEREIEKLKNPKFELRTELL